MCLILTLIAALLFSIVFVIQKKKNIKSSAALTTALAFWGAALMWSVDGIASVISGENFFDISLEDTWLGLIIIGAGLTLFGILQLKTAKSK